MTVKPWTRREPCLALEVINTNKYSCTEQQSRTEFYQLKPTKLHRYWCLFIYYLKETVGLVIVSPHNLLNRFFTRGKHSSAWS